MVDDATRECLLACLEGLWQTDGTVRSNGSNWAMFATCSDTLARQVHTSLLAFGVVASLKLCASNWEVRVYGANVNRLVELLPSLRSRFTVGELGDTERANLADAMWAKTGDTLLIVEPGTPAGFARIVELRTRLIAKGAHVIAPCPHDNACPLAAPDWCHFSQRLARSRAHKHLKGAELPYEDEKFSYVALSRSPPGRRLARVLAQPKISKVAVTMKLCMPNGVDVTSSPHRDKTNYSRAKKLNWGDTTDEKNPTPE